MGTIFSADIQKFIDKAKGNLDIVVRKVSLDLFRKVIIKSPVDTGRFKGNWQVAIGSIPAGNLSFADEDKERDKTFRKTKERSSFVEGPALERITSTTLQVKAGDVITMVNNLPYALALEYGHSKQAPAGMVRTTVEEYGLVVRQAVNEVPK